MLEDLAPAFTSWRSNPWPTAARSAAWSPAPEHGSSLDRAEVGPPTGRWEREEPSADGCACSAIARTRCGAVENSDSAVAEFDGWLKELMVGKGSDLHVKVGSPPMIRLPGGLERMPRDPIAPVETAAIAESIIPADRKEAFDTTGEIDFAYSLRDVGRFRANVFKQRGSISMVLRRLRFGGPTFEEMGLPDTVRRLADEHRGLILVTGPTGSGQDHDPRFDDRLHQRDQAGAHRHDRGPDRSAASRRGGLDRQREIGNDRRTSSRRCVRRCGRIPTSS